MKYYFNPGASPINLYPLVPVFLISGTKLALYDFRVNEAKKYIPTEILDYIIEQSFVSDKIEFYTSDSAIQIAKNEPMYADEYYGSYFKNRISNIRLQSDVADVKEFSASSYEYIENNLDSFSKSRINLALDQLRNDMKNKPESMDQLERFVGYSKNIKDNPYGLGQVLYRSVLDDIYMFCRSGANIPFCDAARWNCYPAIIESIFQEDKSINVYDKDVDIVDEDFKKIIEIAQSLSFSPIRSEKERYFQAFVKEVYYSKISGVTLIDFLDYIEKTKKIREDFSEFYELLSSDSHYGGYRFRDRVLKISGELDRGTKKITQNFNGLLNIAVDMGRIMSNGSDSFYKLFVDAAKISCGVRDASPSIKEKMEDMARNHLQKKLFGPLADSNPIFLQSPERWINHDWINS